MNDRLLRALALQKTDRVPFLPAVYEHKAFFIGHTPTEVSRDESLLVDAVLAEYEALRPDGVVVGIDVYNIEAEACGCGITFFTPPDTSIPAQTPGEEVIGDGESPRALKLPDPQRAGRMPLMLSATERVQRHLGAGVTVMGALSGPFSLACALAGPTRLFMAMAAEKEEAHELIAFATEVVLAYGKQYAARGLMAAVFDSQASPQLISPRSYREFVSAPTRRVVQELKGAGMPYVPLVIGGNTDAIVDACASTGANYLLCDGLASVEKFLPACQAARCAFRRNIPSDFLFTATVDEIRTRARREVASARGYSGFIMGTGVVPYGIATEKITAVAAELSRPNDGGST